MMIVIMFLFLDIFIFLTMRFWLLANESEYWQVTRLHLGFVLDNPKILTVFTFVELHMIDSIYTFWHICKFHKIDTQKHLVTLSSSEFWNGYMILYTSRHQLITWTRRNIYVVLFEFTNIYYMPNGELVLFWVL